MNEIPNPDHDPSNEQFLINLSQNEVHIHLSPAQLIISRAATLAETDVITQCVYQLTEKSPE